MLQRGFASEGARIVNYYDLVDTYLENGYQPIPIKPESKLPVFPGHDKVSREVVPDAEYERMKTDLKRMYNGHPVGIGLPLGEMNGLIAVDIDSDNPELVALFIKNIPTPRIKKVGKKGVTLFYAYTPENEFGRNSPYFIDPLGNIHRVEMLSNGRYTVMPGSIHPDTKKPYFWDSTLTLETMAKADVDEELPSVNFDELITIWCWCCEKLGLKEYKRNRDQNENQAAGTPGRNDYLKNICFTMLCRGEKKEKIIEDLLNTDKTVHRKPLFEDKREITQRAASPRDRAEKFYSNVAKSFEKFISKVADPEAVKKKATYPTMENGFHFEVMNEKGKVTHLPDFVGLNRYIQEKYNLKNNDSQRWYYKDGQYFLLEKSHLMKIVSDLTIKHPDPTKNEKFAKFVLSQNYADNADLVNTDGFINMKSGVYNIKTKKLSPHSPDMFFKYKLDYDFHKDATAFAWLKFLDHVLKGNQELIDSVHEIMGYTLYGGHPFLNKAFCLIGAGRNGKSVLLETLRALVGQQNTCAVNIALLDKPFSTVQLYGKLANIIAEVPNNVRIPSDSFKSLVAGDNITGSYKGKDEFQFKNTARILFAMNDFPRFGDASDGLMDRLYFIPFDVYIKQEDRNPWLFEEIKAELPGVFKLAMEGLDRLLERKFLIEPQVVLDKKKEFKTDADSVYAFMNEEFELFDEDTQTPVGIVWMYGAYLEFCQQNRIHPRKQGYFVRGVTSFLKKRFGEGSVRKTNNILETKHIKSKRPALVDIGPMTKNIRRYHLEN